MSREKFESIKNGCPWIEIIENEDGIETQCRTTNQNCWYKGCAILYWLKNLNCNLATWCECECDGPYENPMDYEDPDMTDEEWYYWENPEGT